ncbi:hypothetical protein ACWN8V_07285 [Vagococcus elongatus]|nr:MULTISPECIES: hypothetical protein [Vagococcus]UDM72736.1 hypothetical protein K5L00_14355 [Vagococcus fluvialis]UDM78458.1 hypothetical protein K5K98_14560 [Vagococcus fluvialis]UDM84011.1 hypothetical protein K5K96_14380 [Vagococcus fluvialis]
MKEYKARIMIENELKTITYETSENPIEYLWGRYGMDSYIDYIEEVVD